LGAYFLNEELGKLGRLGCAICLIGSVIIVLHAPADEDVQTIDEILQYAVQPGTFGVCSEDIWLVGWITQEEMG
jgi:magnesium transporter